MPASLVIKEVKFTDINGRANTRVGYTVEVIAVGSGGGCNIILDNARKFFGFDVSITSVRQ